MKHFIIVLLLLTSFTFGQGKSYKEILIYLQNDNIWPVNVLTEFGRIEHKGVIRNLSKTSITMDAGLVNNIRVTNPLINANEIRVWRVHEYYIATDYKNWYWCKISASEKPDLISDEIVDEQVTAMPTQISGQRTNYSLILDNEYFGHTGFGSIASYRSYLMAEYNYAGVNHWHFKASVGPGILYKPDYGGNPDYAKALPVGRVRASVSTDILKPLDLLVVGTANFNLSKADNDNFGELYSRAELRLSTNFTIGGVFFWARSFHYNWHYQEFKPQLKYYITTNLFIGYETQWANWENSHHYLSQTRPGIGSALVGYWSDIWWLQVSYGKYQKKGGTNGLYQTKADEYKLNFNIGARLNLFN